MKFISTDDGSSSLFIENLNETYHSRHGALRESRFVYIQEGLDKLKNLEEISILEVGMGTGLNVLLSIEWALEHQKKVNLTTLEPFPIPSELLEEMNYSELIEADNANDWWNKIHQSEWSSAQDLESFFSFTKHQLKLEDYHSNKKFDLVYYDAFGPHAQPELWDLDIFKHLEKSMKKGSLLVTYCAQGQFKRNLKAVGFDIERLPGPPGKREMTRGTFIQK